MKQIIWLDQPDDLSDIDMIDWISMLIIYFHTFPNPSDREI